MFTRNLATTSSRTLRAVQTRQLSLSATRCVEQYPNNSSTDSSVKTDAYPDDKHAVNKAKDGDQANIQEANAKAGME